MKQIRHLLPHLYCFSVVAKQRSFTQAAQELNISQSGVSYQIKKLEQQLGYSLMLREPRKPIQLTEKGRTLLNVCEDIYSTLEKAFDEMSGEGLSGELAITSDVCFGTLVLTPSLSFVEQRYPNLCFRLSLQDSFVDLSQHNIDLAIRSRTNDPELSYQPLCTTKMLLVATKKYLNNTQPVKKLEDLYQHKVLCSGEDDFDWQNLVTEVPQLNWQKINKQHSINNLLALNQSMFAGNGIAFVASYTVAEALQERSIEVLLEQQLPNMEISYYLAFPTHASTNSKIQAFAQRLKDYIQQSTLNKYLHTLN